MPDYAADDYADGDYADGDYADSDYADDYDDGDYADDYADDDYADDDYPDCNSGNECDDVYHAASVEFADSEEHAERGTDSVTGTSLSHKSSERQSGQSRTNLSLAASRDSLDLLRSSFTRKNNNMMRRSSF